MTTKLKQINITYAPKEDRLLVKISNSADEECLLWYTRRFTKVLLEALDKVFCEESRAQGAVGQEAQSAFAEYQHQRNVNEQSFQDAYQPDAVQRPMGEQVLLAHTIQYKSEQNGGLMLCIIAGEEQSITLNMDESMKHQFYELVKRGIVMADWATDANSWAASGGEGVVH